MAKNTGVSILKNMASPTPPSNTKPTDSISTVGSGAMTELWNSYAISPAGHITILILRTIFEKKLDSTPLFMLW